MKRIKQNTEFPFLPLLQKQTSSSVARAKDRRSWSCRHPAKGLTKKLYWKSIPEGLNLFKCWLLLSLRTTTFFLLENPQYLICCASWATQTYAPDGSGRTNILLSCRKNINKQNWIYLGMFCPARCSVNTQKTNEKSQTSLRHSNRHCFSHCWPHLVPPEAALGAKQR